MGRYDLVRSNRGSKAFAPGMLDVEDPAIWAAIPGKR